MTEEGGLSTGWSPKCSRSSTPWRLRFLSGRVGLTGEVQYAKKW